MSTPQRILLVRLSHLGDVVQALPVFHALREEFPEAELAWVVQPEFADLLKGIESLDRVVTFDRRGGLRAWLALREELHAFGASWAIDVQGNLKSAMVCAVSGASRRTGLDRANWTEAFGAHIMTESAELLPGGKRVHPIERALHLARHVAPRRGSVPRGHALVPTTEELGAGRARCAEWLDGSEAAPIVVALSNQADIRSWPLRQHAELIARLMARRQPCLLLSGPAEERVGRELEALRPAAPGLRHWIGQSGLRELVGFFGALRERDGRLLGCDSGPAHLAAACGLPVTLLAGPQDARSTGPWPPPEVESRSEHRVVRAEDSPPCAPCLSRSCSHREGPVCMQRIETTQVLAQLPT